MTALLLVGRVMRPHGLSGEVSAEILTDFPERFAPGTALLWQRAGQERRLTLIAARPHGKRFLLAFEGVVDEGGARALCGGELAVSEADAFPAPEGFFYSHEIQGWRCQDPKGVPLGFAAALETSPAGPLLSVDTGNGRIALVPFVHGIVVRVDRETRTIVLDPPEGLLEL
ncbi:MAG: ribosome maturation factor RimM [Thermoanaerobaculia bacterium]